MPKHKPWKIAILMTLVFCCTSLLSVPASALETDAVLPNIEIEYVTGRQEPASIYRAVFAQLDAYLSISKSECATCTGEASALLGYTCDVTLELQQKNRSHWDTIKTWTSSGRTVSFDARERIPSLPIR